MTDYLDALVGKTLQIGSAEQPQRGLWTLLAGPGIGITVEDVEPTNADDPGESRVTFTTDIAPASSILASVRVIATSDIPDLNSPPATIDDVTIANGDYIALAGQSDSTENGIYRKEVSGLVRRADLDSSHEWADGAVFAVREGDANSNTIWQISFPAPMILGTTTIGIFQVGGAAGSGDATSLLGIDLDATTFGAPNDGDVLTYDSGSGELVLAAPVAGGSNADALRGVNLDNATVGTPATGALIGYDGTDYKAALATNANIATGAAIAVNKLAGSGSGVVLISSGGTPSWNATPTLTAVQFGSDPASTGRIRGTHNEVIVASANEAVTDDVPLLSFGTESVDDTLTLGDDLVAEARYLAAGDHTFYRGGTAMFAVRDRHAHAFVEDNAGAGFDYGLKSSYHDDETNGAHLVLQKSRGTHGTPTGVANGDDIAAIIFSPRNGTDAAYDVSAGIVAKVIGAPGAGSVPTALDVRVGPTAGSLATIASFRTDHVVMGAFANVATTGTVRTGHGYSLIGRNNANSADIDIIQLGGSVGNDVIRVGGATGPVHFWSSSSGFQWVVSSSTRMTLNASTLALAAATTNFNFDGAGSNPLLRHNNTSGTVTDFFIRASGKASGTGDGGSLHLDGGRWSTSGKSGSVRLRLNSDDSTFYTMIEAAEPAAGRRVVSLCFGADLTTTQMPASSGDRVCFVANAATNPSANPVGGGILYSDAGAGKWRGTSGTVTTFGPAEPHCPDCGRDFAHEWQSDKYGHLAVCMWCVVEELQSRGPLRGVITKKAA